MEVDFEFPNREDVYRVVHKRKRSKDRASGARVRILFIDEGFGTQEITGREKLLDAIYSIQEDFGRIIVITRINELKEALPVRSQVVKAECGSFYYVN